MSKNEKPCSNFPCGDFMCQSCLDRQRADFHLQALVDEINRQSSEDLAKLQTREMLDRQRADFAYGNAKLSNPDVTREMAEKAVREANAVCPSCGASWEEVEARESAEQGIRSFVDELDRQWERLSDRAEGWSVAQSWASAGDMKPRGEKSQVQQIPYSALLWAGRVLQYGSRKYARGNWRNLNEGEKPWEKASEYLRAAIGHTYEAAEKLEKDGTVALDAESGLPHLAHAMVSLVIAIETLVTAGLAERDPK